MKTAVWKNVRTFFGNINMKNKLMLSYFMLIFIPLAALTVITNVKVSQSMTANVQHSAENALEQSVSFLETKIGNIVNMSNVVCFDKTLQDVLTANPQEYDADMVRQYDDQEKLRVLIGQLQGSEDAYRIRLYIRDIPGFAYDENFRSLGDIAGAEWMEALSSSKEMIAWLGPDSFEPEDGDGIVAAARRIVITRYNNTDGVLRIDLNRSVLDDIVNRANITASGLSCIVNSRAEVISLSGDKDLLELPAPTASGDAWSKASGGSPYLVTSRNIAQTDWKFISVVPYSEIEAPGKAIRDYMIVLMLMAGVLSYIIAYAIASSITNRLRLLTRGMKKVTGGDFAAIVEKPGGDEIGQLTHDFNFMVGEMGRMISERYETGKQIKALELKSLQAQINPHFLYNSLDMINWSAAENGNTEIEEMVQALSRFYKLGLSKGRELVSLRDELEHVKSYVTIQNLRYGGSIRLTVGVDDGLMDFAIPKITIQPIVENSIQHGIIMKPDKSGNIKITAGLADGELIIAVRDDGAGIPEDELKGLLDTEAKDVYHGYGLKNIDERLKLHYGGQYGLGFESAPGEGTLVTIRIPAVKL